MGSSEKKSETDFGSMSSNIISDFAPILALFGEQVAKQFLSQSMGWGDHIIFSMAPLGIITAVVSAIRIGGPQWLKAIVGRAREHRAAAELELMSSTSHEVCELWNGQNIVRTLGAPDIQEVIMVKSANGRGAPRDGGIMYELHTLDHETSEQLFEVQDVRRARGLDTKENVEVGTNSEPNAIPETRDVESTGETAAGVRQRSIAPTRPKHTTTTRVDSDRPAYNAPNISLNINNRVPQAEIYVVAVSAVSLQAAVLVYGYNITYNHGLRDALRLDLENAIWAWYCTLIGTALLVAGVLACCLIIEKSTVEKRYRLKSGDGCLLWLQKGQTVSDQVFYPSMIKIKSSTSTILTSRRNEDSNDLFHPTSYMVRYGTIAASVLSISGFIVQFMGLRGMHWSVSVAQFTSTGVMSVLRAFLRRGLSECPQHYDLPRDNEIDWLSVRFSDPSGDLGLWDKQPIMPGSTVASRRWRSLFQMRKSSHIMESPAAFEEERFKWKIVSGALNSGYSSPDSPLLGISRAQIVVNCRERLGDLTRWPGRYSDNATSLAASIDRIMNTPGLYTGSDTFLWYMRAITGGSTSPEVIEFRVARVGDRWVANLGQLDAVLSLWMYSAKQDESYFHKEDDEWLRSGEGGKKDAIRLLGRSTPLLRRDLRWWMGTDSQNIMDTDKSAQDSSLREPMALCIREYGHRVVGSAGALLQNEEYTYVPMILIDHDGIKDMISGSSPCPGYLFSSIQSSLQSLFALEMFTAFMWAFAASPSSGVIGTRRINGQTKLEECPQFKAQTMTWDAIRLHNPALSKVTSELESTGLGNSTQLLQSIIPPLSAHRKLPDTSIVVQNIHERTKDLQRVGQWGEAYHMHFWVLECFLNVPNHFPSPTGSNIGWEETSCLMAIAISMEFLWILGEEIEKHKNQKLVLDADLVKWHKELKILLTESKFHSLIEDLLLGLARLYEMQGRRITWEPLLSIYNSRPQNTIVPRITDLHKKIISEDYKGEYYSDIDQKDDLGWTALHYMAKDGRVDIIKRLVENSKYNPEKNADWRAVNLLGWTPLHYAALNNSLKLDWADKMDKRKLDVNIQGRDGVSPLHCAGRSDNVYMANDLIRLGANLNVRDNGRKTPLHWSAYYCSAKVFGLMLVFGAEFRSLDEYGRTCLHLAAMSGSVEIVDNLLNIMNIAEINLKERNGRTALWIACSFGHENILEKLAKHRKDVIRDNGLLYKASKKGLSNAIRSLLQYPTNSQPTQREYEKSLYVASRKGHTEIVRLLLENRVGVRSGIPGRKNALFAAGKHGHLEIIKLLRDEGFRMKGERAIWEKLVIGAGLEGRHEVVKLLLDKKEGDEHLLTCGPQYHELSRGYSDDEISSGSDWESTARVGKSFS
ncbi:hypothetical protein DFP73DRAFT_619254 [Morchella snyderi]|nr:hypothetical protein DFP73DRAFT_619254 [Morchella snyderi]